MKWTEEKIKDSILDLADKFDPIRMPTNREIKEMTGSCALSMAIQKSGGYRFWAKQLGLEQKKSETKMAQKWERITASILERYGHKVELTSAKHPYDILVDGCVKIDVKAANISEVRGTEVYAYRIAKPQQTCDFYVCCENDGDHRMYVIPANAVNGQKQIEMGAITTKYDFYKEAWYLIDDTAEFFKRLVIPF